MNIRDYKPISDYGIIGNLDSVALITRDGSIDWCCLPRMDSPSVFGAILNARHGGFFRIGPFSMIGVELLPAQIEHQPHPFAAMFSFARLGSTVHL